MSKRYRDTDKKGYFLEFGQPRQFTTYRGVRYVKQEQAKNPVIDLGQDSENKSFMDSFGWQFGVGKTPGF